MASNKMDGGKCKGGSDVKARLRHNDCTPEKRKIAVKGNEHIDPAKSHLNVNLTGDTYAERCAKYDSRIAELDAQPGANKRKDRVTAQLIETPVPEGLPREKYNAFLTRVLEIQKTMFGAENLVAADIHWDEEHEYVDADTHETVMSRVHLHSVFIPVQDGKLKGQAIYNRKNLYALNNAVQKMAADEFEIDFLTGEGKSSKKTVGQLKAQSEAAAIVEAARTKGAMDLHDADNWADEVKQEAQEAAEAILSNAEVRAKEIIAEAEREASERLSEAQEEAQTLRRENERLQRRNALLRGSNRLYEQVERYQASIRERLDNPRPQPAPYDEIAPKRHISRGEDKQAERIGQLQEAFGGIFPDDSQASDERQM